MSFRVAYPCSSAGTSCSLGRFSEGGIGCLEGSISEGTLRSDIPLSSCKHEPILMRDDPLPSQASFLSQSLIDTLLGNFHVLPSY